MSLYEDNSATIHGILAVFQQDDDLFNHRIPFDVQSPICRLQKQNGVFILQNSIRMKYSNVIRLKWKIKRLADHCHSLTTVNNLISS